MPRFSQAIKPPMRARRFGYGKWFRQGPQEQDAVSGWHFPERQMIKQRGALVSQNKRDGSIDEGQPCR